MERGIQRLETCAFFKEKHTEFKNDNIPSDRSNTFSHLDAYFLVFEHEFILFL